MIVEFLTARFLPTVVDRIESGRLPVDFFVSRWLNGRRRRRRRRRRRKDRRRSRSK